MDELIKLKWQFNKCVAEIPGVAMGKGDNAEKALKNLIRSLIANCKDRCHTCGSSDVSIEHKDRIGKFVDTFTTNVTCRECGTTRVDNTYIEKRSDYYKEMSQMRS